MNERRPRSAVISRPSLGCASYARCLEGAVSRGRSDRRGALAGAAQALDAGPEGAGEQAEVGREGDHAEAPRDPVAAALEVVDVEAADQAVAGAGGRDPIHRLEEAAVLELAGDAHRERQVEVADPEHVDPLDPGDL